MLKRFFAFLVSFALITNPLMAEGLNRSDLNFAFGQSDTQVSQLSSDLSMMTDQQMSETEGEWVKYAYKALKKIKDSWGRKGGKSKERTTTKNGKKSYDKHTKPRPGRQTKQRLHPSWSQR